MNDVESNICSTFKSATYKKLQPAIIGIFSPLSKTRQPVFSISYQWFKLTASFDITLVPSEYFDIANRSEIK